ncbi:MAG: DUF6569 family protein [Xanthomonadales bacterium]|nr:DUF6569 family protein [Xanthomonadales bacterium]
MTEARGGDVRAGELLAELLRVRVGKPRGAGALRVVPLLREGAKPRRYWLLGEALARGEAGLHESGVGVEGAGPERVPRAAALVDGELLVGAWQNRTVARSALIRAEATAEVGVFCVERGRWSGERRFRAAGAVLSADLREDKMRRAIEAKLRASRVAGEPPAEAVGAAGEEAARPPMAPLMRPGEGILDRCRREGPGRPGAAGEEPPAPSRAAGFPPERRSRPRLNIRELLERDLGRPLNETGLPGVGSLPLGEDDEAEISENLQSRLWRNIDAKLRRLRVEAPTGALTEAYRSLEREQGPEMLLSPEPGESGAVFLVGGRVLGLELLDDAEPWRMPATRSSCPSYRLVELEGGAGSERDPDEEALREAGQPDSRADRRLPRTARGA